MPGVDYALSEVVHCKSWAEKGVKSAAISCSQRYLDRVFAESNAVVVVVMGGIAREIVLLKYNLPVKEHIIGPVKLGGRDRHLAFLPHTNARKKRTFRTVYSRAEVKILHDVLTSVDNHSLD